EIKIVKNNYKILKEKLKDKEKINSDDSILCELKNIKNQIDKNITISNKLLENYAEGIINETQYRLQNKSISKNLDNLVKRKDELEIKLNSLKNPKQEEKALIGGIDDLLETPVEKWNNAMIKAIINKVKIYTDGTIRIDFKYIKNI
ncbi:hypothetical protein, partial [Clostridium baratii]|uniref:hypothetical protein n=1 Tax=Clostridium baratii TaxID=1561 RepID=UPI00374FC735